MKIIFYKYRMYHQFTENKLKIVEFTIFEMYAMISIKIKTLQSSFFLWEYSCNCSRSLPTLFLFKRLGRDSYDQYLKYFGLLLRPQLRVEVRDFFQPSIIDKLIRKGWTSSLTSAVSGSKSYGLFSGGTKRTSYIITKYRILTNRNGYRKTVSSRIYNFFSEIKFSFTGV